MVKQATKKDKLILIKMKLDTTRTVGYIVTDS